MSNTPETDKEEEDGNRYHAVSANFARKLERERDQLKLDCITLAEELEDLKRSIGHASKQEYADQAHALAEIHEAEHPRKL